MMLITRRQFLGSAAALGASFVPDPFQSFARGESICPASIARGESICPASIDPQRTIEFHENANAYVIRDRQSAVRAVLHTQRPVAIKARTACKAAEIYLRKYAQLLGVDASQFKNLCRQPEKDENLCIQPLEDTTDAGVEYRFLSEKPQFDVTTITFWETRRGVPRSYSGISIHLKKVTNRFEVICVQIARDDNAPCRAVALQRALMAHRAAPLLRRERFKGHANAKIFLADPVTTHGGPGVASEHTDEKLNPLRGWTALPNLVKKNPQELIGRNVKIVDIKDTPHAPPPKQPEDVDFVFDVNEDEFAAVNAYYNCDRFFTFVEGLGFERDNYFQWTQFPIEVDHRGSPNPCATPCRSAQTVGKKHFGPNNTEISMGIQNVQFALAGDANIGNANDWRVVLHELGGHGTLLNHIAGTRFRFAHSAGDSLAAILNAPESNAKDKGDTFPWNDFRRRHDGRIEDGWAWDGPEDTPRNDLHQEQILSTTHFRLYQSIGGADCKAVDARRFAAKYSAYLILRAIQTLTPITNPEHASDWLCNLIVADCGDWTSEGHRGGAYKKVIWWAFEKQGLFGCNPPPVDVYIDDGRHGEYWYQANYDQCLAIWNRRTNDGDNSHQTPIPDVVNFAYVKIKNRGTQTAKSVVVDAFQNKSRVNRNYPEDWIPMRTPRISAPDVPPQSTELIIGPFQWNPATGDNFILMAVSARGDASNLRKFSAKKSIANSRLVPHDNNLGLRKV